MIVHRLHSSQQPVFVRASTKAECGGTWSVSLPIANFNLIYPVRNLTIVLPSCAGRCSLQDTPPDGTM